MADLDGFEAMLAVLEMIPARVNMATADGVDEAASYLKAVVQQALSRTSHAPGTPTPSPPGSPPSLVSGRLWASVDVGGPTSTGSGRWSASVSPDTPYAAIQERGGTAGRGAVLPARPYMAPSLVEALPGIAERIEAAWADVFTAI